MWGIRMRLLHGAKAAPPSLVATQAMVMEMEIDCSAIDTGITVYNLCLVARDNGNGLQNNRYQSARTVMGCKLPGIGLHVNT